MSLDSLLTLIEWTCRIIFHTCYSQNLERMASEKLTGKSFIEIVSFSKAESFTSPTFHLALNKVLHILAPSFLLNNVAGFIFSFITEV